MQDAIEALSAPVTLEQAMQCPDVQAMVDDAMHRIEQARMMVDTGFCETGVTVDYSPATIEAILIRLDGALGTLAPILALSANNPAPGRSDSAHTTDGDMG